MKIIATYPTPPETTPLQPNPTTSNPGSLNPMAPGSPQSNLDGEPDEPKQPYVESD